MSTEREKELANSITINDPPETDPPTNESRPFKVKGTYTAGFGTVRIQCMLMYQDESPIPGDMVPPIDNTNWEYTYTNAQATEEGETAALYAFLYSNGKLIAPPYGPVHITIT
jgi:hypothetical protein